MKTQLGHYEIVEELGRGGMGVVYKGFEPALNRHVAIKELSPSLANDPSLVERFLREARSMAALNDPHIIQIYFIGQENGQPFFVMEFVEGDSLSQVLRREGKLSVADALKIMHQTAQGLATAHDRGVVHRDIKPGNLMLDKKGRVKIADFGIALATQDISKKLTSTGEFVGTPGYLSPEVCLAKPIDQRSDIFSLGIVLFEMLTGRMPFSDESPLGLMLEVVKAEIPDIRELNREVDAQTYAILSRMVAKDPADRFQSCHDLAAALSAHPEVAKGGGLGVRIGAPPPASDATVIGAPTPASQKQRAPTPPPEVGARAATPAPVAAAAAPAAATRASASAARPSTLEKSTRSGGWKLPVAIAAAVVLMLGGSAFAFRDYISGFIGGYRDGFVAARATNPVAPSTAADLGQAPAQTTADGSAAAAAAPATSSPAVDAAPAADLPATISTLASAPAAAGGEDATGGGQTLAVESGGASAGAAPSSAAAVPAATAPAATGGSSPDAAAPAVSAANPAATQVAKREPVRPVIPRNPRILVVAMGDNAITTPAAQRIEQALSEDGFDTLDASVLSGVDEYARAEDVAGLLDFLARRNAAEVLLVIRAEPIGTQQLQYYGRSSTLYSAYLGGRAYVVAEKRPLGPGFRKKVDFAALNADAKADEAVGPELIPMLRVLRPFRPKGRG